MLLPSMTTPNDTDPRLETRYMDTISGTDDRGQVTLVGVVHDHPASNYRVRTVLEEKSHDVLALELPPLAVPLYEEYAATERVPPALGGELSAAVQATSTTDIVGIDGPSVGFVRALGRRLYRERASLDTVKRSAQSLLSITGRALACRVAASVAERTPWTVRVGSSTTHPTSQRDLPDRQAADEQRQIRTATAVLDALESSPSSRYRSESRERYMADRLETLRQRGDVVAVVGAGHFDTLCRYVDSPGD